MQFCWGPIFRELLPKFRGKVVLCLGPVSPFHTQICTSKCAISWERQRLAKLSLARLLQSWPSDIRLACKSKIFMVDPAPMALPMFFDGETDMISKTASQHWHRYDLSPWPGRKVFGIVADTLGHLFLSQLLNLGTLCTGNMFHSLQNMAVYTAFIPSRRLLNLPSRSHLASSPRKSSQFRSEPTTAVAHTARACAQCPRHTCCPWRPVPLELLASPVVPSTLFLGSRFPYTVANPKKGCPDLS